MVVIKDNRDASRVRDRLNELGNGPEALRVVVLDGQPAFCGRVEPVDRCTEPGCGGVLAVVLCPDVDVDAVVRRPVKTEKIEPPAVVVQIGESALDGRVGLAREFHPV